MTSLRWRHTARAPCWLQRGALFTSHEQNQGSQPHSQLRQRHALPASRWLGTPLGQLRMRPNRAWMVIRPTRHTMAARYANGSGCSVEVEPEHIRCHCRHAAAAAGGGGTGVSEQLSLLSTPCATSMMRVRRCLARPRAASLERAAVTRTCCPCRVRTL